MLGHSKFHVWDCVLDRREITSVSMITVQFGKNNVISDQSDVETDSSSRDWFFFQIRISSSRYWFHLPDTDSSSRYGFFFQILISSSRYWFHLPDTDFIFQILILLPDTGSLGSSWGGGGIALLTKNYSRLCVYFIIQIPNFIDWTWSAVHAKEECKPQLALWLRMTWHWVCKQI